MHVYALTAVTCRHTMRSLTRSVNTLVLPTRRPIAKVLRHYKVDELLSLAPINSKLKDLPRQHIKGPEDVKKLPKEGGVYFIATNEPIHHIMHPNTPPLKLPNDLEIVYNGTASDLRSRIKCHLLREKNKGMSGIAVDILITGEAVESHTKIVCSSTHNATKKTPYKRCQSHKLEIHDLHENFNLSPEEFAYLRNNTNATIYFQNGINVTAPKHASYDWYVYYQEIESHSVRDIVENTWRREYGMPRLCSYKEGR